MLQLANISWADATASTNYPFDDRASCLSDVGVPLPPDVLTDLVLRYAGDSERTICVSAVAVSPGMASILVSIDDGTGKLTASAYATIALPEPWKTYALLPLVDGVSGWVTFGPGVSGRTDNRSWAFGTTAQGALLDRCGFPFSAGRVRTVRSTSSATQLTGPVKLLSSDSSLLISKSTVTPPGEAEIQAINIGLPLTADALSKYLGPCDVRPEAGNCANGAVYDVSGAVPDAEGVMTIAFGGPVSASIVNNRIVLSHSNSQAQICTPTSSPLSKSAIASCTPASGATLPTPCTQNPIPAAPYPHTGDPLAALGPFVLGIQDNIDGDGHITAIPS